ncbi:MAG TPA: TonB-dependent receptor [Pyrinomonadaceae bacterium]|nr:TonB-dependent receptor [Pyrinomonadaceae bacterium]
MFRVKWFLMLMLVGVMFSSAASAFAQSATGQLSGTVVDPNGARVPGAAVRIINRDTALERQVTTDENGDFAVQLLPPGKYRAEISAQGFGNAVVEEINVNVAQTATVDVKLEAGTVQGGTVTVTAEQSLVQGESSQVGRVIEETQIRQLPLPTRNFQQLLTLSPGTSASVSNNTELGRGDTTITVNGQRTTSNNVRINGIDANSIGTNSTPNIAVPATDSIQEFIVQTSLYDASQGRNAGGNVEAITKSGSNDFHGNLYEFFRNRSLNSNDFFLKAAGQPKPVLSRNQFGGTIGGPIIRNKLFFFTSYQGTRERNGASLINSLMSPVLPTFLTDNNRTAAGIVAAFNAYNASLPVAQQQAALTAAQINPVSLALLQTRLPNGQFAIPSPTTSTGLTPISGLSTFRENQFNGNVDIKLSDVHSFAVKAFYASNPTHQANYNFAGLGNGSQQLPGFGGDLDIIQTLTSLTDTYVFSPNIVNQARIGFSRLRVTSVPEEPFTAQSVGITNPLGASFPGVPTVTVAGLFTLGSSTFADQSSRINAWSANDTLSYVAGAHRLRFGGEFRYSQVNFYFNAFSRGFVQFSPTSANPFSSFATFLTGGSAASLTSAISIIGSGVFDRALRTDDLSAFAQDDWKVSQKLTLNLGLRYDFYGLPHDARGRLVNFLPDQFRAGTMAAPAGPPNGFVQAGNATNPILGVPLVADTLVPNDMNNFAPRVGFAYSLSDARRIVLRGGYGIYYDRLSTRYANTQLLDFPYLALAVGLVNPLPVAGLRTFSSPFIPVPQPTSFPVVPTVPSPLSPLAPFVGVPISGIYVDPNIRTPYIQQYNTNVQWEFANNYLLEVGYVGSKGTKLLQVITLNQPVYNAATNSFTAPFGAVLSTQKNTAGGIQQVQSTSLSHYNSLQVSVTKRFSQGLQFLAAYTFGRSTDYYSGAAINELAAVAGDQFNWRTNLGPSDYDRKHRFVYSFVYDLPKVGSDSEVARALFNNWEIAGILTLQSGLPFSIIDNPNNNIIQRANFNTAFSVSVLTSGSTTSRLNQYFNTGAFVTSRPILSGAAVGTASNPTFDPANPFGNTPRNFLRGPGQKNVDFSIIKFIPFSERLRGEFRTEFFNIFNWTNFANPGTNIANTATFGRITQTTTGPRVIQFAFKLNF